MKPEFYKDVDAALERIAIHIRRTPVEFSHSMSNSSGCKVLLKLENLQITGSFKARGAVNKMSLLAQENPEHPIGLIPDLHDGRGTKIYQTPLNNPRHCPPVQRA